MDYVFFLKTDEITGSSIYAEHWLEILLSSFQAISDTQIKITLAPSEFVAAARFYEFADQKKNLKISKAVLSFAIPLKPEKRIPPRDPANGMPTGRWVRYTLPSKDFGVPYELSAITVTKAQISTKGTSSFILTGKIFRGPGPRDPANGMPMGRRFR